MKPLTPAEAADLARVCQHPDFDSFDRVCEEPGELLWEVAFNVETDLVRLRESTLRACLRAAVRWMEENDGR